VNVAAILVKNGAEVDSTTKVYHPHIFQAEWYLIILELSLVGLPDCDLDSDLDKLVFCSVICEFGACMEIVFDSQHTLILGTDLPVSLIFCETA
jgi:hypothetical protein